jgi:hypothetical protein
MFMGLRPRFDPHIGVNAAENKSDRVATSQTCLCRDRRCSCADAVARLNAARVDPAPVQGLQMKISQVFAAGVVALSFAAVPAFAPAPAQAIGCLSGGAAGAVAGHYAHHHAVLGAIGGCIAGHHMHKVQKERARAAARQHATAPTPAPTPTVAPTPAATSN